MIRRCALWIALAFLSMPGGVGAQEPVVLPDWTIAPTAPFVSIGWDDTGNASWGMLAEGLGIAPRRNLWLNQAGTLSLFTLELPQFFAVVPIGDDQRFTWRAGIAISTLNVFGLGAAVRMIDVGAGEDFGVLSGNYRGRPDWSILLSVGFNITNGTPAASAQKAGLARSGGSLPYCIGH